MKRIIIINFFWKLLKKTNNTFYIKVRHIQFKLIKRKIEKNFFKYSNNIVQFDLNISDLQDEEKFPTDLFIKKILSGEFTLLGQKLASMPPDWHLDPKSKKSWKIDFHEKMKPFSTIHDKWDKKIPWEKSRLQFLLPLSIKYIIKQDILILNKIEEILNDWLIENPEFYGINWANSMEVGIRAINIIFCLQLIGNELNKKIVERLNKSLLFHFYYIDVNPEVDFSFKDYKINVIRNNHFIFGSLGGLYLSTYFNFDREKNKYISLLENEIEYQFYPDGGNFEHSIPYHFFTFEALLMFFFLRKIELISIKDSSIKKMEKISEFTKTLIKPNGAMPKYGDNDSGCILWHHNHTSSSSKNYLLDFAGMALENEDLFFSDNPSESSWLVKSLEKNKRRSQKKDINGTHYHRDTGIAILNKGNICLSVFSGPKQSNNYTKGHAHNDCFSFDLNIHGNDIVANRGTYTYADIRKRNEARSANAHNVCLIDEHEINIFDDKRPFNLEYTIKPTIDLNEEINNSLKVFCSHQGFKSIGVLNYNRYFFYEDSKNSCSIVDSIEADGYHNIEWYFHIPQEKVFLSSGLVSIKIGDANYYIRSENKFNNISLKQELYWPEYGEKRLGHVLCFQSNNNKNNKKYRFNIGSVV